MVYTWIIEKIRKKKFYLKMHLWTKITCIHIISHIHLQLDFFCWSTYQYFLNLTLLFEREAWNLWPLKRLESTHNQILIAEPMTRLVIYRHFEQLFESNVSFIDQTGVLTRLTYLERDRTRVTILHPNPWFVKKVILSFRFRLRNQLFLC